MFRFDLTVSDQAFEEKLQNGSPIYRKITFTQKNVSLEEFAELIFQGRLFSGVYNKQHFHISQKTINNFIHCNAIAIDIDDSDCPMDDYLQTLRYTPTIAYETFSNLKDGCGYRYRFIYVFEDSIDGNAYGGMYKALCNANAIYFSSSNDHSMERCNQMFYGTANASNLINFGKTYNTSDFKDYMDNKSVQPQSLNKKSEDDVKRLSLDTTFNDKAFKKQWRCGNDIDVLMTMRHYQTSECTQIDFKEGELWRDLDDEHYYEIKRKWETRLSFNGGRYNRVPINRRLKNGEHRRKKIFLSLMRRRLIDPTITLEHLCYAALYELHFFIDNTDNEDYITRQQLMHYAQSALSSDLEQYKETLREHKSFKINKMEARRQGITPRQAVCKANGARRKEQTNKKYEELAKKYDPDKSVRQNVDILGVSKGTVQALKKWLEDRKGKEYPPIEEETSTDMCCEDMIKDIHRILKNVFEPQVNTGKNDLYWLKKPMKHLGI